MKRIIAIALSLVAFSGYGQRDFEEVQIRTIPVSGNIYMLEGRGGNIGVSVGEDGILIVDDQFAPLAGKIEAALAKLGPGPLRFVLNTHHHGDHTGGNSTFAEKGATLVAQSNVRKRLASDAPAKAALPIITFDESASVHFNGEEIKLIHHGPGHTDGDSVIHFTGSHVIHMGDLFFNGGFPYVDLGSGGSVDGYIESVATLLKEAPADSKVIPGHGSLATIEELKEFHAMLVDTVRLVREAKADGKTLDQAKNLGLPDRYSKWGSGFISTDRWIETVYSDTKG